MPDEAGGYDLADLLRDREQLSRRLDTIEAALGELERDVQRVDAEIEAAARRRREMVKRGRRMFALLQETRCEIERYDTLIQQVVEEIAARFIGPREGAYLLNGPSTGSGHGFVIARTRVGDVLYTSLVEIVDTS